MRIVAALGGNALLRRGEPPSDEVQRSNVERAARALAPLAHAHQLVITHGNGPQIGLLALQQPVGGRLDVLGAETQGMIGYLIEEALRETLPGREVATILTQVEVRPDDPAFRTATKPIGPIYDADAARRFAVEHGWTMVPDTGGFRRAVPSPEPVRILELPAIRTLLEAGLVVVCAGGGGVPVRCEPGGQICGVEAVIDKDLASALLATSLKADHLLLLTDVDAVYVAWRTPEARSIAHATPAELRQMTFAPGSMGPKVEAACRFVEATSGTASIGSLEAVSALMAGTTGTTVHA